MADPSHLAGDTEAFAGILRELAEEQEVSSAVRFPVVSEWDRKADRRFLDLADREAKGTATAQELEELEALSDLRRRFEAPHTGQEVLREYEQHQLVRNLLQSLTRYVEFIGNETIKPSSTRSRAKAKA
jgi:hypothetical protein